MSDAQVADLGAPIAATQPATETPSVALSHEAFLTLLEALGHKVAGEAKTAPHATVNAFEEVAHEVKLAWPHVISVAMSAAALALHFVHFSL